MVDLSAAGSKALWVVIVIIICTIVAFITFCAIVCRLSSKFWTRFRETKSDPQKQLEQGDSDLPETVSSMEKFSTAIAYQPNYHQWLNFQDNKKAIHDYSIT